MKPILLLGIAALLLGCNKPPSAPDPVYETELPTMEDVDDTLAAAVEGERVRVIYDGKAGAIVGAAKPLVTIVEWSDFQCPYCGKFAETLAELVKTYPDDVRLVFMQFPLPMHPDAKLGAQAAIAAGRQGKFWAMHDVLFGNRSEMKRDDLIAHARDLGLDGAAFEAALTDEVTTKRLAKEQAIGRRLGVSGTPTFFVNGLRRTGAVDGDALVELIEQEREHANRLMAKGCAREEVYARIMRAADPAGARARGEGASAPRPTANED